MDIIRKKTGVVRDPRYLCHDPGIGQMEVPRRLESIYQMLDEEEIQSITRTIAPRFATLEELEMVHDPRYIELILDTAGEQRRYLDPDTMTSPLSCEAAWLAVGGVLEAVRLVLESEVENSFAFVRPPGHHAERNRAMGFCLFNNACLAVEFARRRFGLERVLVVDWDLHHGNGIQHFFYEEPGTLFFSTHRFPFFPGTGDFDEVGRGRGEGFTVNVPLDAQKNDADFANLFRYLLVPIALEYQPELIVVCAGFDTHHEDPIGGMKMTEMGYARLAKILKDIAAANCGGVMVMMLEGGYDVLALRNSCRQVLRTLAGLPIEGEEKITHGEDSSLGKIEPVIERVRGIHKKYWRNL
ncbi:MAG: histone deacetylase [Deltaproteobacteria bacterium]|nr:histone deacetylase [Deltaproteobacteria bacterium]